ncbi:hypothetical protein [Peptostreptococcus porci]|uniref:hypothetical protein n=1 Tax=Peptostreptococcus porci TaxID=2652282 RepID=UPI002A834666|nr:hypothetical protein [Peptostreptococcus porci]MDY4127816.1 hypothetical protein [Peptostreptococcus porci]
MKKFFYLLGVVLTSITLVACSNPKQEVKTVDNDFIELISEGLEKRYSMVTESEDSKTLFEAIKLEQNNLKQIEGKEFQNPELKTLYEKYLEQLKIQEENYMHFNNLDNYERHKVFMGSYNERSKIISTLIDKYGLKLNQKLSDEFKANSVMVISSEEIDKKIIESFSKVKFYKADSYIVRGDVKNETGEAIQNKSISAKFINKDNITVDVSEYYINGVWEADEVRNIEFYLTSDKSFDKIEFSVINY